MVEVPCNGLINFLGNAICKLSAGESISDKLFSRGRLMIWIGSKDHMNQVLVLPPFQALVWIVLDDQYNFVIAAFLVSFLTFSMDREPQRFKNATVGIYH